MKDIMGLRIRVGGFRKRQLPSLIVMDPVYA